MSHAVHQPEVNSSPPVRQPIIHHHSAPPNQLFNPETQSFILGAGHADFEAHNKQLDVQAQANLQVQQQFLVHRQPLLSVPPLPSSHPYAYGYTLAGPVQYYGQYPPRSGTYGPGVWYTGEAQHDVNHVMGPYGQQQSAQKDEWYVSFLRGNYKTSFWSIDNCRASVAHSQLVSNTQASAEELEESSSKSQPPSPTPIAPKRAVPLNPGTMPRASKRRRNSSIYHPCPPSINPSAPAFVPGRYEYRSEDNVYMGHAEKETYNLKMERWLNMDDDEFLCVQQPLSVTQTRAITDAQAAC